MSLPKEKKQAKRMMYLFLGISILCFIIMVTTATIHKHLATAIVALAGMWASNGAYKYWKNQKN